MLKRVVHSERASTIKVLTILFGHLWEVELTYRYSFAFKFIVRSQQPDIVPIIIPNYRNVDETGGKFAACRSYQLGYQQHLRNWWQNLPLVSLIPVVHLNL